LHIYISVSDNQNTPGPVHRLAIVGAPIDDMGHKLCGGGAPDRYCIFWGARAHPAP